jgi:hypothetical protein
MKEARSTFVCRYCISVKQFKQKTKIISMTPEPFGANYLSAETKKCYEDILASYTNIYNNAYIHCNGNLDCTNRLKDYFNITKWNINQPVNLSTIYTLLDQEKGVQTVQKVEIVNKAGGDYSEYAYDIKGATKSNIVYPSYDPMIFEVKYLDRDIKGRITTL